MRSSRARVFRPKLYTLADVFSTAREERSVMCFALMDTKLIPCVKEAIRLCELESYTTPDQILAVVVYSFFIHVNTKDSWELCMLTGSDSWIDECLNDNVNVYNDAELDVKFATLAKYLIGYYDVAYAALTPLIKELCREETSFVGVERVINDKFIIFIEYHGY